MSLVHARQQGAGVRASMPGLFSTGAWGQRQSRPKPVPNAPGMFAFADRDHVTEVVTAAGWAPPRFEKLDMDLDIAAGRGLEEAVVQSTQIGAVNSWLRNQPAEVVSAAVASVREALAPYADGASVRLPGAMWLISSAPA